MNIQNRVEELRSLMKKKNIDVYIVPSADNHQSEYVGEYFKARSFITGFTGSAGTAVFTQTQAGLWTDGRYFIQAEHELQGSGITLYKMGNPGVPTIEEYLDQVLPANGTLGFDGRVISMSEGENYRKQFSYKNIQISYDCDLIDEIWTERPAMSDHPVFLLDEKYSGESTAAKLERIRKVMQEQGATTHILITLDDIAWLLNMRGRDVLHTPVVLSYVIVKQNCVHLFIDERKLSQEIKANFAKDSITLHPYNHVYEFISKMDSNEVILLDPSRINYALYHSIPQNVKVIENENPCIMFKAMKNDIEIANIKQAHIKDGVAQTKFMYWLKNTIGKEPITELSASDKIEEFRAEQENFLWPSFSPISAYGANAAMCHYSSTPETDCELKTGNFFLTDTGGNYLEGSTDITRTYAIGDVSSDLKYHFTTVLRAMMGLARGKFLHGCNGQNLDILARQYLWNDELDYNHGTGHGVGYLLSIHEDPCGFRWRSVAKGNPPLEAGMILTDEPGIYIEGSHGIRIENELLICKGTANEYGQFMYFEPLTFVPIDLDAVDASLLRDDEKEFLNNYHKRVYELISPHLSQEEKDWLKIYTREL